MPIVAKSKKVKDNIVDENGNVLGTISYNPEDTKTYTKLSNIMQEIFQIDEKRKSIGDLKELPKERLKSLDEFEEYKETFEKMNETLNFCDEKIENIKKEIDDIFGQNTSKIMMEDSNDIELLLPLIESVIPIFEKIRNKKINKHLEDDKKKENDVME